MRTETQTSAELAQLCKLIENMPVAMLTSIHDDGALVSRPMTPLKMDGNGVLWFFIDLLSAKVFHQRVVNLSFTDPARATYVSLSGRSEMDEDYARIERMWTPLARPWFPNGPYFSNLALLKFLPDVAEYWVAPHGRMVRMLAMTASVLARKPIGLGEHDIMTELSRTLENANSG